MMQLGLLNDTKKIDNHNNKHKIDIIISKFI